MPCSGQEGDVGGCGGNTDVDNTHIGGSDRFIIMYGSDKIQVPEEIAGAHCDFGWKKVCVRRTQFDCPPSDCGQCQCTDRRRRLAHTEQADGTGVEHGFYSGFPGGVSYDVEVLGTAPFCASTGTKTCSNGYSMVGWSMPCSGSPGDVGGCGSYDDVANTYIGGGDGFQIVYGTDTITVPQSVAGEYCTSGWKQVCVKRTEPVSTVLVFGLPPALCFDRGFYLLSNM